MAYAGLDVGTSGCKIAVYDLDGKQLYQASRRYREEGTNGHRELNADMVAENVLDLLAETGRDCPAPIDAMAVASLGESVVCLGGDGKLLAPSMLTGDCRGIPETEWMIGELGQQRIMKITGLPPNELYSLPKLIWLKQHTDVIDRAAMIFFFEDYIGYLLTGKRMVSYSSACRSMAFDIREKKWSEELLELAGITAEKLSRPVEAGTTLGELLPEMAKRLGLNPRMKLVAGGHDQSCAALGSGLYDRRGCETSMGTCEFMLMMLPGPVMTPYMIENDFTCIPYVLPDTYLSSLEVTTCGILKDWGRKTLFSLMDREWADKGLNFYGQMEERVAGLRTDVLALPQFGSSGNPDLSMDARGTITGLTIHTKPEEIYLALIEGMSFQLYLAYERLQKLGPEPEYIVATGGGAASDTTLQIRANVFNMKVIRPENAESGTLGCMLLAALGTGAYATLEEGIYRAVHPQKTFLPDPEAAVYYRYKYLKYKTLYQRMYDFK
ncbi:MAG: FGGY family carbohydrate kinase [Eubacteriales bacterium]|nr:FGGY family carbohydrate kinase [Eubacteriales bacterium]